MSEFPKIRDWTKVAPGLYLGRHPGGAPSLVERSVQECPQRLSLVRRLELMGFGWG